mmetsp:Transcript_8864/g.22590  ORF Transcript_8864/g.22590 Transcript_8864/m.22590 type:complete len:233 (-) Transcript_8864:97-795(-)
MCFLTSPSSPTTLQVACTSAATTRSPTPPASSMTIRSPPTEQPMKVKARTSTTTRRRSTKTRTQTTMTRRRRRAPPRRLHPPSPPQSLPLSHPLCRSFARPATSASGCDRSHDTTTRPMWSYSPPTCRRPRASRTPWPATTRMIEPLPSSLSSSPTVFSTHGTRSPSASERRSSRPSSSSRSSLKPTGQLIDKHKACIVAQGFRQIPGLHYDETYSPTLRYDSLRGRSSNND